MVDAFYHRVIDELILLLDIFNDDWRQLTILLLNEGAVKHRNSRAFGRRNGHVQLWYGQLVDVLRVQSEHPIGLLLFFAAPMTVRNRLQVYILHVNLLWRRRLLQLLSDVDTTPPRMLRRLLMHNHHCSAWIHDIVVSCLVNDVIVSDVDLLGSLLHHVDEQRLLQLLLLGVPLALYRSRGYRGLRLRNIRMSLLMMPGGRHLCDSLVKLLLLLMVTLVSVLQLAVVPVEPTRQASTLLPTDRYLPRVRLLHDHCKLSVSQSRVL